MNNSIEFLSEIWFIPLDVIMLVCSSSVIILAILFLSIILFDKTCHTVSMMLIGNTCLTSFVYGCTLFGLSVFMLRNDLKQICYQDSLCIFRGYLSYSSFALQNYSYLLLSLYRYIIIVYPTNLVFQSVQIQIFLIILFWILGLLCPVAFLFTNDIIYNINNQICQIPLRFSFPILYGALISYVIPISMIMFIYSKLVRYVKRMSRRVAPANTLNRVTRELKMVRQIVLLVIGVTLIGLPYALFILMSFINRTTIYHFRIAYLFMNMSMVFAIISIYQFTDQLKSAVKKKMSRQANVVGN